MAVRLARTALVVCVFASVACGLVFSPGDYAESPAVAPVAETGAPPDVVVDSSPPVDAGTSARVMLIAGRRASIPGEATTVYVAETMRTTLSLSSSNVLGPWTFDVSPPIATGWTGAFVAGDALLLHTASNVFTAKLGDRITGEWTPLPPRGGAPESFMRPWIVSEAGLTSAGGQAGATFTGNVYVAPFNLGDGGVDPWQSTGTKLVKSRGDVTLLRHGRFLYAVGGRDSASSNAAGRDEVEVASFGADGALGTFTATTKISNPSADAASHGVVLPVVAAGAGHLFVIGGQTNALASSLTDVVLAAKIDEATGNLGAWVALPRLPEPMSFAGAVAFGNTVVVFGGSSATTPTDAVIALSVQPDGTFEPAWRRIGSLPGPRSNLAAVVY